MTECYPNLIHFSSVKRRKAESQFASGEAQLEVEMLGDRYSVSVLEAAVYDPDNERMRC